MVIKKKKKTEVDRQDGQALVVTRTAPRKGQGRTVQGGKEEDSEPGDVSTFPFRFHNALRSGHCYSWKILSYI